MVFDAREAQRTAETIYRPWQFVGLDGHTYELPHPLMANPATAIELQTGKITEAEMLERDVPEAWAALQAMSPAVMRMTVHAYNDDMEASMRDATEGKELSPPSPINRSERRSKQTQQSAGSTSTRSVSGKSKGSSRPSPATRQVS